MTPSEEREQLEARLALVKLEEQLVEAKESEDLSDTKYRNLKEKVRAARQDYRENHRPEGNAAPETIRASAAVKEA